MNDALKPSIGNAVEWFGIIAFVAAVDYSVSKKIAVLLLGAFILVQTAIISMEMKDG